MKKKSVEYILLWVTLILHAVGIYLIWSHQDNFIHTTTPVLLWLMAAFWFISYRNELPAAILVFLLIGSGGFMAEIIGVHTGWLFGKYRYGTAMGLKLWEVPLVIGANWVLVVSGAYNLARKLTNSVWFRILVTVIFILIFDLIMEPAAVRLGYWHWYSGHIPVFNYVCWGLCGLAFAFMIRKAGLGYSKYSGWLVMIQSLFFSIVNILP